MASAAAATAGAAASAAAGFSQVSRSSEGQQSCWKRKKPRHSCSVALGHNAGQTLRWVASSGLTGSSSNGALLGPLRARSMARRRLAGVVAAGEIERSYIMIKPDGVQRGLVGEIISRFERKGFTLKGLKLFQTPQELAEEHYGELKERPFFPSLVQYIVSGPVVAMVWEGPGVVASARKLIGVTNPLNAEPGTIRGDFGVNTGRNVVHGSDSPENGAREIKLWFKEGEVIEWEATLTPWILE